MEFVTDRTLQDVLHWQTLLKKGWANMNAVERAEWLTAMKGAYGATDMNRVESAVKALSARLSELGYKHDSLSTKTDWTMQDVPTKEDFDRYFSNVEVLRQSISIPESTPETPTTKNRLNYHRANDLEKILQTLDVVTTTLPKSWYYAGEIFTGEV